MNYRETECACRRSNTSATAIHQHLLATRVTTGSQQKELAVNAGIKYMTFRSIKQSRSPPAKLMRVFLAAISADFNFILGGKLGLCRANFLPKK
ncbi:hypothetical protein [Phaeobacter sp. 11ANDIMAR09]|uniref:hypothetical protein n=1 Tax=Phaeobacter sp. 11ANDIMAR09 TaxID=1225647 RepID=UPI0012EE15D9|nr:hypothetical protein [Phaeobacter sp. 11ANDIMAR09]